MKIGIAGFGKMGAAIADRLQQMGESVVAWNRTREKVAAAGVSVANTPRELAEQSDVIISILFDASALEAVYKGSEGLLAGAKGKLFIEMSTVRPETQKALASEAERAGGAFVESPVGGTTGPARAGQLLGLVGGKLADVERARPVLEKLCRRIEHLGDVGAGSTAKLAINLPLLAFWQSFGEAMALAKPLGKDPEWLVQLFSETAGGANVLKVKGQAVAAALAGSSEVAATFDINSMRKDLQFMLEEAAAYGINLPVAAQTLSAFDEANAAGIGTRDCSYIPAFWANKSEFLKK